MRIVYFGNNQRGIRCLEKLAKSRHEVIASISQKGESGWYESLDNTSKDLGIPSIRMQNPNSPENMKKIKSFSPDLAVMCGYSKVIGEELLEIPREGFINLHASLLPNYRGAAPLNWALINGEKEIGISIYRVDKGIDTGVILAQKSWNVNNQTTINDLAKKAIEDYPPMLLKVCDQIENEQTSPIIQDLNEGSYFTKRHPSDGIVKWDEMNDKQVHNLVRALTHPYPGAYSFYEGKKVLLLSSSLEQKNFYGVSGRVAAKNKDDKSVTVITKNRGVRIKTAQLEEGKEKSAYELFKIGKDLK